MFSSFSTALSALDADSTAIDTTGDNLANLNTTGFKSDSVNFLDLVSSSMGGSGGGGLGVSAPLIEKQFTQGSVQTTSVPTDAAIQGGGFFVVQNPAGEQLYTRAGNFTVSANGTLQTLTGEDVQGWTSDSAGNLNTNGAIGNITIPTGQMLPPSATTTCSIDLNLDAQGVAGQTSGTFTAPLQVVDSMGETHDLTVTFTKSASSSSGSSSSSSGDTWSYAVTIPAGDLASSSASTTVSSGTVTFDANGNLASVTSTGSSSSSSGSSSGTSTTIPIAITGLADGAADMSVAWNTLNTDGSSTISGYAAASSTSGSTQNGTTASELDHIAIGDGGQITAVYTNGREVTAGQLALASITNPNSLEDIGNNNFAASGTTAAPSIGVPGTGGRGEIVGSALESSNVDIATEFTNLIVYQRSYQANSRVITTTDDLMQETLNLKQQ